MDYGRRAVDKRVAIYNFAPISVSVFNQCPVSLVNPELTVNLFPNSNSYAIWAAMSISIGRNSSLTVTFFSLLS